METNAPTDSPFFLLARPPATVITRNGSYPNILEAKSSAATATVLIRPKSDAAAPDFVTPPLRVAAAQPRLLAARRPSLPSRYPPPSAVSQQQQQPSPAAASAAVVPEAQHLWPQFPGCVPYPHWYESIVNGITADFSLIPPSKSPYSGISGLLYSTSILHGHVFLSNGSSKSTKINLQKNRAIDGAPPSAGTTTVASCCRRPWRGTCSRRTSGASCGRSSP